MECIIEHVIEHSVEWNSSIFIDAFHSFSSFKPFLGFLILPSTNSYSYIFMLSVWHSLLVIENIKHMNFTHLSHWADSWITAANIERKKIQAKKPKHTKKEKTKTKQNKPNVHAHRKKKKPTVILYSVILL